MGTYVTDYDPIRGKWNNQKVNLRDLKESLFKWQEKLQGIGWNSLYWNNHDNPRCVSALVMIDQNIVNFRLKC